MKNPLPRHRTTHTKTQSLQPRLPAETTPCSTDRALLNMEDIWDFITTVDISDISGILDRQIRFNSAIAEEGLRGDYGANIGTVLLRSCGNDIATRAKAMGGRRLRRPA